LISRWGINMPTNFVRFCACVNFTNIAVEHPVKKTELTTRGIRCADHATPSIRKCWH
jgi:hypothetical protein